MPKDPNITKGPPRALAGVASLAPTVGSVTISSAASGGGQNQLTTGCDVCGLNLPRSATHVDVLAHPCYRSFSISLTAAGLISLA